jgi:hypothetical protein
MKAASVGTARRPGDENGDVNITATVRNLSVEGGPVKNEDNEVKLEGMALAFPYETAEPSDMLFPVLEDDDEKLIAYGLSGRPAAGAGVERKPAVADVTEDSTQAPQGNLPSTYILAFYSAIPYSSTPRTRNRHIGAIQPPQ